METIKEHILSISDKVSLPSGIKIDHDYAVAMAINCPKIEKVSLQQNNEYAYIYKAKIVGNVEIEKDLGQWITATSRKSLSKRFRDKCFLKGAEYDSIMLSLLADDDLFEKVVDLIKNKI
jgi:hypothetical protein